MRDRKISRKEDEQRDDRKEKKREKKLNQNFINHLNLYESKMRKRKIINSHKNK